MALDQVVEIVEKVTKDDVVLVADTSFLTRLSLRNVWAYQCLLMTQGIAREKGKRWLWRAPSEVISRYNSFFASGTVNKNDGVPLALCGLEELFGDSYDASFNIPKATARMALKAPRVFPGKEDVSVLVFAAGLTGHGAEVYVASYDIKDIVVAVRRWNNMHEGQGLKIGPLPPSELNQQQFDRAGLSLNEIITSEVVARLQTAKSTGSSYPVVVFEKGVRSGTVVFDAGIGVVQKEYFKPLELPPEFESIQKNFKAVPLVRVGSLNDASSAKNLKNWSRQFGVTRFVVVEEESPYSPLMVSALDITRKKPFLFTAGLDFLYWQTGKTSAFAQAAFKPVAQRAPPVSIPK